MNKLIATLILTAACQTTEMAMCDTPECLVGTLEPEQLLAAVKYVGPCFAFGQRLCKRVEYCTASLESVEQCIDWWIQEVCSAPFEPTKMSTCTEWAEEVSCEYWNNPEFYPRPQTCLDNLPRPVGGIDTYPGEVPAALR